MTTEPSAEAREAAANWCEAQPFPSKQAEAPAIRDGSYDHHSLVQAFARFEAQARLAGERAGENDLRAALEPVMHWYQSDEHPERPLVEIVADVVADLQEDRAFVLNPPKHKYWMPGEPDCPREIKAGNGELHTLRCKVCGQDGPRDDFCRAAIAKARGDA